ncbi:MAG: transglutaminase-like cysteine peptidase [Alphaproteobacteria bacterium]
MSNKTNTANTGIFRNIKNALRRNKLGETLVLKGYISSYELKSALKSQKETQKPLGQIFIEQSQITKSQLTALLFRQKVLRLAATTIFCAASLGGVTKKSHAGAIKDVPARIMLASTGDTHFKDINQYPDLFGAKEKKSTNLKAFTKWTDMFDRFDKNLSKSSSKRIIQDIQSELAEYKSSSIYGMAKQVNAMMNKQKYIGDNKNWGKSDYWATPIEFMTRGGDCEDFAIAKYVALRAMGVPENHMRIAIVQDQMKNIPHAILIVYSERGAIVLDNQIKDVRHANSISHYKPIFSINREAWWLHTPQKRPTTIVAAAR